MSDSNEIVVWLPLRPGSSWRGEGIAQTVENILTHVPADLRFRIVVSTDHAPALEEIAAKHPNLRVQAIKLGFKPRYVTIEERANAVPTLRELIGTKVRFPGFGRIKNSMETVLYMLTLYWHYFLQRQGWFLRGRDVYWFPTPIIPGTELIKANKVCSFWDPFVFEYREFGSIAPVLFQKFRAHFKSAKLISTQSQANKDYLINVFGIEPTNIKVLHNGSPDYSRFGSQLNGIGRRNAAGLLAAWSPHTFSASTLKEAKLKLALDAVNKSILWRLMQKASAPHNKIIMISTQVRPYKGFGALLELMDRLVKTETDFHFHFVLTAEVPNEMKGRYPLLYERIHEITRVQTSQHAMLYYIADLVLHPSYAEGGLGVYPQFEAASVGTPTLVNVGRHVLEQTADRTMPPHTSIVLTDLDDTVRRINTLLASEELKERNLQETRSLALRWEDVAQSYADMFRGLENV